MIFGGIVCRIFHVFLQVFLYMFNFAHIGIYFSADILTYLCKLCSVAYELDSVAESGMLSEMDSVQIKSWIPGSILARSSRSLWKTLGWVFWLIAQ